MKELISAAGVALAVLFSGIGGCMRYMPEYTVWQQGMVGKAELAKADQNRQIKIAEAKANLESTELNAQAEVARARGAAAANEVMAKSLSSPGTENYLRWKYIHMLETNEKHGQREIIYIPVDGLLPLTEASRAVKAAPK